MWEVVYTDQCGDWWDRLAPQQQESPDERVMLLAQEAPKLKRPVVGKISQSRHEHMKEPRTSAGGARRVLFAFDPRRHAILPLGGDQTGRWKEWYRTAIPEADYLYDAHLEELNEET